MRMFHNSTLHLRAAAVALSAVLVGMAGCAATIRAGRLPQEFQATAKTNVQETGLRNLVIPPFNSQMIDCGDVLEVTIVTDFGDTKSMTTPVRVERDGMANIPLIGRGALAGFELDEAGPAIAAKGIERGVFRRPHVTVTMKRKRMNQVTVIGAVNKPGVYELPTGGCSLLTALVTAGDLAEDAGDEVTIRRPIGVAAPRPLQQHRQHVAGRGQAAPASYNAPQPAAGCCGAVPRLRRPPAGPPARPLFAEKCKRAVTTVTTDTNRPSTRGFLRKSVAPN